MRIGELADLVGVPPRTIRFYESIGVLPPPPRTASGYRDYDDSHAERLRFIKVAQSLGFRLDDIGEILALRDRGEQPCDYVAELMRTEVARLDERIRELRRLKSQLEALVDRADELRGSRGSGYCPIISHRSGGSSSVSR